MTLNIHDLEKLTCSGVYALINIEDKKVDIRYSSNLILSLVSLVTQIKEGSVQPSSLRHDFKKLEVSILEKDLPEDLLKIRHAYWMNYYKRIGYRTYRKKVGSKWKLQTTIEQVKSSYYFFVKLVNKKESLVIGIFDNNIELNEFLEKYYRNGVQNIVYACNNYTSNYIRYKEFITQNLL